MKKKLAMLVLACALSASALTGCGEGTGDKEATKTEVSSAKEDSKKDSAEQEEKSSNTDYASWTGKDWKSASDEEKEGATKYCLIETTKAATEALGQEWNETMEESVLTDEAVQAEMTVLEAAFTADENMKMSDLLEQASGVINDAADQVEQITQ